MKKALIIATIIFLTAIVRVSAQTPVVHPIPSFNYAMNEQSTYFHENKKINNGKEKRDMDVVVNTRTTGSLSRFAVVYVFKIQPQKVLGPFYVFAGQHLEVPIDNGKWGVRVDCNFPADVSVWAED
jgi:hypothetical protein